MRRCEVKGMGRSAAAIMGVSLLFPLGEGFEGPWSMAFITSFSNSSLYGTVCGE